MSSSLYTLRQTTKEILAAAVLSVFPGTQLLGGDVSETLFHYDFYFLPGVLHSFGQEELRRIEDQMSRLIHEKVPIRLLEMVPKIAENFLDHHGQRERAIQVGEDPSTLLEIFQMGSFYDACPGPYLPNSSEVNCFKLLHYSSSDNQVRIEGTAFFDKNDLKEFIKRYKVAQKGDIERIGPKLGLIMPFEEEMTYLPNGEKLRYGLISQWRQMHEQLGFEFVHASSEIDPAFFQEKVAEKEQKALPYRLAQLVGDQKDFCSIFCQEEELLTELISSLHFFEQTIKIFRFERRVYLFPPQKENKRNLTLLSKAIEQVGLTLSDRAALPPEPLPKDPCIEFRIVDRHGNGKPGPLISLHSKKPVIYRSLIRSIDQWVIQMIEQTVGDKK